MKKAIYLIAFIMLTSAIFAQYKMTIKKIDNTTEDIWFQDISEITFADVPYELTIKKRDNTAENILIQDISAITFTNVPFTCGTSTIIYAGQTYNTVQIGSQCWLQENLDVGTMLQGSPDQTNNSVIEKYCYNDDPNNCATYGGLYQWAEAVQYQNGATNTTSPNPTFSGNVQGICPTGWHLPTQTDFQTLEATVNNDGNALKAIGQGSGSGSGTNTSGFSALLGGYRQSNGVFSILGTTYSWTMFWTTSESSPQYAYTLVLSYADGSIGVTGNYKGGGFNVRCIKD
jgi:uncharacterized protein (TIGR02145 family)